MRNWRSTHYGRHVSQTADNAACRAIRLLLLLLLNNEIIEVDWFWDGDRDCLLVVSHYFSSFFLLIRWCALLSNHSSNDGNPADSFWLHRRHLLHLRHLLHGHGPAHLCSPLWYRLRLRQGCASTHRRLWLGKHHLLHLLLLFWGWWCHS